MHVKQESNKSLNRLKLFFVFVSHPSPYQESMSVSGGQKATVLMLLHYHLDIFSLVCFSTFSVTGLTPSKMRKNSITKPHWDRLVTIIGPSMQSYCY